MQISLHRTVLISGNERANAQAPTRLVSVVFLAGLFVFMHVLTPLLAGVWLVGYLSFEAALRYWWGRIQPGLLKADDRGAMAYTNQMNWIVAATSNWTALPCLMTVTQGGQNAVVGLLISAGSILILTAQPGARGL